MKEIRYLGDFKEDIHNLKEPVTFRNKIEKFVKRYFRFFTSLVMLGYAAVILLDVKNILLGELLLPSVMSLVGVMALGVATSKSFKQVRTLAQSEHALLNLRKNLSRNFGVSVSKKNLQESSIVKSDEINFMVCNKENKMVLEEKLIHYFELLDREDQILVLKYVRNRLIDENASRVIDEIYQLLLLENGDFELESIPVTRKLKR